MSSLLARTLGSVRAQDDPDRVSRASPYARPTPPADGWKHDMYGSSAADEADARGDRPRRGDGGAGAGGGARRSKRLVISNLHYDVSERELEHLFAQVGPLANAPSIKFDRSGRSTGLAFLGYGSEKEATEAKEAFDGALAKGQNIKVEYDNRVERVVPEPGTLLARLAADDAKPRRNSDRPDRSDRGDRGDRGDASTRYAAPSSTRGSRGGGGAGPARSSGGRGGRDGGAPREKREPVKPKTNEELDKELEAFMTATPKAEVAPAAVVDVEMT